MKGVYNNNIKITERLQSNMWYLFPRYSCSGSIATLHPDFIVTGFNISMQVFEIDQKDSIIKRHIACTGELRNFENVREKRRVLNTIASTIPNVINGPTSLRE